MRTRILSAIVVSFALVAACNRDPNVAKQKYVENGNKYFEKKKYKEAVIMYKNALKRDLKFGEAYYRLALAELQLGRYVDAARSLQRAVELQPQNLDAHNRLTNLYLNVYLADSRRPKQLLNELQSLSDKYSARFKDSYEDNRLKGYLALLGNDSATALTHFGKANSLKPYQQDLVLIYMQTLSASGRAEEGEKLAYDMLAKHPDALGMYDALVMMYARQKRVGDIERVLHTKIGKNPKSIESRLQLAAHYFTQQNREQMMDVLRKIKADTASFPTASLHVGDFFLRIRELDLAAQSYTDGIRAGGKDKPSYQKRLVEVMVKQGRRDEANQLIAEVVKENPKDDEAIAIRASMSLLTGTREQLQSAINDLQSVISRMPENPVLRYNLGRALLAKQDWQAAKVQFEEAVKLRSDYLLPRIALAQLTLQNGEWGKVLQMTQEILNIDRNSVPARLLRSRALIGMGDGKSARQELEVTAKQFPELSEARLQMAALDLADRDYEGAESGFKQLYSKSQDPRALMGLVDTYVGQKQHEAAIKLLNDELSRHPERLEYRAALGNIAMLQGQYKEALAEYNQVVAKAPRNSRIWLQISEAHRRAGNLENAMDAVKKAQEYAPTNTAPHLQAALLYDTNGRPSDAKPMYEQVLRLQPDNPIALNNLAFLLAESGQDLDQALTMAQKAKQQLPNDLNVADTLGWIYIKKNLADSAIGIFRDLVARQPQRATFHYHLGMALYQKGEKPQARQALETALKNQPTKQEETEIRELLSKLG